MTSEHDPRFTIGEVATTLGVSREVLRLYERRGLILVHKNGGRQRRYSESDIERLKCIRSAITRHKISLEGMRRVQAMIPCWKLIDCPEPARSACPAFRRAEAGCWTYRHAGNACAGTVCRDCTVYHLASNCDTVKSLIQRTSAPLSVQPEQASKE